MEQKVRTERKSEIFRRIIWSLAVIVIFGGAVLFANSCGGGGGGSDTPKAENSDSNTDTNKNTENSPPDNSADPPLPNSDNTTPPPDNADTTPPPDVKTGGLIQIPRTGQTISYAKGDDGDIRAGASWPDPRFVDNGNNTVTDNLTGLMWMKKGARFGVSTLDAAVYVDKLNRGLVNTGTPYIDWRIPNVNELRSLSDFSKNDTALPANYFPDIKNGLYWTSTTLGIDTLAANPKTGLVERLSSNYYYFTTGLGKADLWLVRGLSTGPTAVPKTGQKKCYGPDEGSTHPVDCGKRIGWIVQERNSCYYKWRNGSSEYAIEIPCNGARQDGQYQAGIAWPDPRFVDNSDTVTDQLTGLMWTKNSRLKTDATWQQALDYVTQMNKDKKFGYADWRLPNINELFSVIDCSGMNYAGGCSIYPVFQGPEGTNHWSSTTYVGDITHAWYWVSWLLEVGMHHGAKTGIRDAWPVRTVPAK